ncbi:hypothetical protein [Sphingomonas colocasiae]|uniref:Uncharacterized protein n=1 Tax=Sphingomonas colocasiae TaxID=1848973 RepID=A0ABS7PWA3_9SPHN|nr:hypothetical protein [Sphingomonas colocasiae]MBY8825640.1 hypothetical protein [Sphingomonas colocasiae]
MVFNKNIQTVDYGKVVCFPCMDARSMAEHGAGRGSSRHPIGVAGPQQQPENRDMQRAAIFASSTCRQRSPMRFTMTVDLNPQRWQVNYNQPIGRK